MSEGETGYCGLQEVDEYHTGVGEESCCWGYRGGGVGGFEGEVGDTVEFERNTCIDGHDV